MFRRLTKGVAQLTLFTAATMLMCRPAYALSLERMTMEQTVRQASAIFVGQAIGHQSRWYDATRRAIVTDYLFQIEQAVLPSEEVQPGRQMVLTFWGGTVGDTGVSIAGFEPPVDGQRYVIVLNDHWSGYCWTPAVGFHQGIFRVEPGTGSGSLRVEEYEGGPLEQTSDGRIVRSWEIAEHGLERSHPTVGLDEFIHWLGTNPYGSRTVTRPSPQVVGSDPGRPSASALRASANSGGRQVRIQNVLAREPWAPGLLPILMKYDADGTAMVTEFQRAVARWNYYVDILRPDPGSKFVNGNFNFRSCNGRSEFFGYMTSDEMHRVGLPEMWDGSIGTTLPWTYGGTRFEADVFINGTNDVRWTTDEEAVYQGTDTAQGLRETIVHELGHAIGLEHSDRLAVMNYSEPSWTRAYSFPFADDVTGVRDLHPQRVKPVRDLAIYLFYQRTPSIFDPLDNNKLLQKPEWDEATYDTSVVPGGTLTVKNYQVENVGTTTIDQPDVVWYLSTARNPGATKYELGTVTYSSLAPGEGRPPSAVGVSFKVPDVIPPGQYYLYAYIYVRATGQNDGGPDNAFFSFGNNYAWSRGTITVNQPKPTTRATTLTMPSVSGQAGQTVTLVATLQTSSPGPLPEGRQIQFFVDGSPVGSSSTGPQGAAGVRYQIPSSLAAGVHALKASFAGDAQFGPSQVAVSLVVATGSSSLTYANGFESGVAGGVSPSGVTAAWSTNSVDRTPSGRYGTFLGQFANDVVRLTLTGLPSHRKIQVRSKLFIIGSWDGNSPTDGPDLWQLRVAPSARLVRTTFNNGHPASVSFGQSFPGSYPGTSYPARTGALENDTLGFRFIDGVGRDFGVMDSVYQVDKTFNHQGSSITLEFSASNLRSLADESWGLDDVEVIVMR